MSITNLPRARRSYGKRGKYIAAKESIYWDYSRLLSEQYRRLTMFATVPHVI